MDDTTCVFCELIESGDVLARFAGAVALRPQPTSELAPGHTLVVPIGHADGLLGASEEQLRDVIAGVRAVANGMRTALGSTGTCVLQATGPDSGGSVRHLHMHVVPCWEDDGVVFWPEQVSVHRIPVTREGASAHDLIAAELNTGSRRAQTTDVG